MKIKKLNLLDIFFTNTYLIWDEKTKKGIVVDPADKAKTIFQKSKQFDFEIKFIVNTHGHGDHIGANAELKNLTKAKICIHSLDNPMLSNSGLNFSRLSGYNIVSPSADIELKDGDEIKFGSEKLKVIHTPGHSKGSICLLGDGFLISGDTLFFEGVGRTDLAGAEPEKLIRSIKNRLFILPDSTKIYPGHGETTTITHEKRNNPFVL
ncbi:MAG: MBL fold metallo-hydrolase [Candidatus Cloacimonetes bacterium]|nr:MBL fold metallo-hydrolase [Candidatus Cloacimonadota bacterium]